MIVMLLLVEPHIQVIIRPNQSLQWRSRNRFKIGASKIQLSLHLPQFRTLVTLLSQAHIRTNNNYHHRQQLNNSSVKVCNYRYYQHFHNQYKNPNYFLLLYICRNRLSFNQDYFSRANHLRLHIHRHLLLFNPYRIFNLCSAYPQEPSLIQSQLLLQSVPLDVILKPYPILSIHLYVTGITT